MCKPSGTRLFSKHSVTGKKMICAVRVKIPAYFMTAVGRTTESDGH